MNELVKTDARPPLLTSATPRAIIPADFDSVWRFSQLIHASGWAPKDFNSVEKIAVAVLHGLEVGLTPMAAMQSIAVINGRPAIWGDGAIALVWASGLCESVDETTTGDGEQRKAVCLAKRKGTPKPTRGEFSVAQAKTAGLWGKQGPWTQYPDRMLQMRARAFALRDAFADVLRGLSIAEEQQDVERMRDVTPPKPPAIDPPQKPADVETTVSPQPYSETVAFDFQAYVQLLDASMSECQTPADLDAYWQGRIQPPRALKATEVKVLTGLLAKHRELLSMSPTNTPTPEEVASASKRGKMRAAGGKPREIPDDLEDETLRQVWATAYDAEVNRNG